MRLKCKSDPKVERVKRRRFFFWVFCIPVSHLALAASLPLNPKPRWTLERENRESTSFLSLGSFWRQWLLLLLLHPLQLLSGEAFQLLPSYMMFKPISPNQASMSILPLLFFKKGHLFLSHLSLWFVPYNL